MENWVKPSFKVINMKIIIKKNDRRIIIVASIPAVLCLRTRCPATGSNAEPLINHFVQNPAEDLIGWQDPFLFSENKSFRACGLWPCMVNIYH